MDITHRVKNIKGCGHKWQLIGGSLIKPLDYYECERCKERKTTVNALEYRTYVSPACIDGIIPKGKLYLGLNKR